MSCTRSYGKSIIELLLHTTSFKKIWRAGKYLRLTKIQSKLIPVFHSTIPFHCSIPLIPDSPALLKFRAILLSFVKKAGQTVGSQGQRDKLQNPAKPGTVGKSASSSLVRVLRLTVD